MLKIISSLDFPFSVDGTFYERNVLLKFIKRIIYHNPVTLESFGIGLAKHLKYFANGLSPIVSEYVNIVYASFLRNLHQATFDIGRHDIETGIAL